jgi:hypothetical protein
MAGSLTINAQIPKKFIGTWDCKIPNAEYGFQTAICKITKDSVFIDFKEANSNHVSDWIKVKSDTLQFEYALNYERINCWLIKETDSNLKGHAIWSTGETPVTCTRVEAKK